MKIFVSLLLSAMLLFGCCALAEVELQADMKLEEISAWWGEPVDKYGAARIWEKDGKILIASFEYSFYQEAYLLRDYVLMDEDRTYISGTIPAEDTLFHVYDRIASTPASEIPHTFGIGSSYDVLMTADGYLVIWWGDCPNIFFDMHMKFYDCVEHEDFGGRMFEYFLYTIFSK